MIPKAIRDRLGLSPGDEVVFVPEEGGVRVQPAHDVAELGGTLPALGLVAELEAEHRRELDTEAENRLQA